VPFAQRFVSDNMPIASNGAHSPTTVSLSGAGTHAVEFPWVPVPPLSRLQRLVRKQSRRRLRETELYLLEPI
jgi:hypothetical protein